MKSSPTLANGKICYLEIQATDIVISFEFYRNVFKWNIRERSNGVVAFDDGINEVSGVWVLSRELAPEIGILIYIMVDSIEEMTKSISGQWW